MPHLDIIGDILYRLREAGVQVPPEAAQQVEQQARVAWGGQRPYVPRWGEIREHQLRRRNARVRAAAEAGTTIRDIAQREGISTRRVQQILQR